jgi:putative membrane protein
MSGRPIRERTGNARLDSFLKPVKKGGKSMIARQLCRKILLYPIAGLLACTTAFAQSHPGGMQPSQQPTNPTTGTPTNDSGAANPQTLNDQVFVRKALEGGDAEVQLGQLAKQKSQSADVKQFGQKMVEDHTQLGEQMKPIAKQLGVSEPKGPSKKDKQLMAKLEGLSSQQFDEEYIKAMVKDHRQDLKEFKSEAQTTQDPNVKLAAQQGATVISQHLQMIEQIAQNHNVAIEGKSKETSSMR